MSASSSPVDSPTLPRVPLMAHRAQSSVASTSTQARRPSEHVGPAGLRAEVSPRASGTPLPTRGPLSAPPPPALLPPASRALAPSSEATARRPSHSPARHPVESTNPTLDSLLCNGFPWRCLGVGAASLGIALGHVFVRVPQSAGFARVMASLPLPLAQATQRLWIAPSIVWAVALLWGSGMAATRESGMALSELEAKQFVGPWWLGAMAPGFRAAIVATLAMPWWTGDCSLASPLTLASFALSGIVGLESAPATSADRRPKTVMALGMAACAVGAALCVVAWMHPVGMASGLVRGLALGLLLHAQYMLARQERVTTEVDAHLVASAPRSEPAIQSRREAMQAGKRVIESALGLACVSTFAWHPNAAYALGATTARVLVAAFGALGVWLGIHSIRVRPPH